MSHYLISTDEVRRFLKTAIGTKAGVNIGGEYNWQLACDEFWEFFREDEVKVAKTEEGELWIYRKATNRMNG